jgi:subtilisin-like proprotein convertase family protein
MQKRTRIHHHLVAVAIASAAFTGHMLAQPSAPPTLDASLLRDYDIRINKELAPAGYLERHTPPPDVSRAAFDRRLSSLAELQADFKNVQLVPAAALDTIEIVRAAPGSGFLTGPSADRVGALRGFLGDYAGAFALSADDINALDVVADYENPAGNMAWVELEQRINGLPVFGGILRGGFTAKGELAATTGQLAPAIDPASVSLQPGLSAAQAISTAAASVGWQVAASGLSQKTVDQATGKLTFAGPLADDSKAWLLYFPLTTGVARLGWATEVWGDPDVYFTIVDAEDGTVLFRRNLTDFQTQSATYHVYNDDSPAPSSPSPALPGANYQAPYISRTAHTLIGNEAPNAFNNLGWMTDGLNETQGNNVIAGIDRVAPNGVDATVTGSSRVFNFTYNPETDSPLTVAYQNGDVTNMFYWVNKFHDATYLLGFTEAARNFQNDNFGRGGVGNDRVSAEGQDGSGTNNANFSTPADGGPGRMQMYLWTGPTPDRSGDLDRDIILHELTHGLSNRLHLNAAGLSSNMSRGMGEGWSDFYARSLFATADESIAGIFTIGGWATHLAASGYTDNYYHGIRRFPYAVRTSVGTNGMPFNPLTFADIDQTQFNISDGAYPRGPFGSATVDQVHNIGEVWGTMLWEVRARFIARLGFAVGNQRVLQYVTDGMKLDPGAPTLIQARDSIIAAANASGATAADIADIWAGFATRGLGVLASVTNAGTGANNTRVVENFNVPGESLPSLSVNDVSIVEGNAGTTTATFTVTLNNAASVESRVSYSTVDGTATGAVTQTSGTAITIPNGAPTTTSGAANPYPAPLTVAGLTGNIQRIAVRLNALTHTFPDDVDILLVGPGGQNVMLVSDVGGGSDVSGVNLTLDDGAPALGTGQITTGTYSPTDVSPGDILPAPAPAGPYGTLLSAFNGTNPNGTWNLYVNDDASADVGALGSFSLVITVGTADYVPKSGLLTFPPGTTTRTVDITINGDMTVEPNETFTVMLSSPFNATIADGEGTGTILNDDGNAPAAMISPPPGSHLTTPTVTFTWSPGGGVSEIWLDVGTAPNTRDIYGASQGTGTSRTVPIRLMGGTIYVKLWSLQSGIWSAINYTYTSANNQAVFVSPAPGATLPGASALFRWTPGTGVAEKWLAIGTTLGGTNIYNATQGGLTERVVSGLPTNGSVLYARLWSLISGVWLYQDIQVRASDATMANMTSPVNGSTLPGGSTTFTWTNPGVDEIWLSVGTLLGGTTLYDATQGTGTSRTVTTLPLNGTRVYVRLWSREGAVWRFIDYQYDGAATLSQLVLPAANGHLPGATALFKWTDGAGVIEKWLTIGTAVGAGNLYNQSQGMLTERSIGGLPTNGSLVYIRLWSRLTSGTWTYIDYTVRAADSTLANMTSPANGATVGGGTGTFTWTVPGGIAEVWLSVGTTIGGTNIYNLTQGVGTSRVVNGLPTNGAPFYVRLWSRQSGVWKWIDYYYVTPAAAQLVMPVTGGTLPGATATFRWTAGVGVAEKWLSIGTSLGASDIYDATQGSLTERTVGSLPTVGSPVYVRLWSLMNGSWVYADAVLNTSGSSRAQMQSPASGGPITGGTATFTWTRPGGVSEVYLEVGTTPGGTQFFDDTQLTNTSRTLTGLPTSGVIYVRLWSKIGGVWHWIDYHYTAAP